MTVTTINDLCVDRGGRSIEREHLVGESGEEPLGRRTKVVLALSVDKALDALENLGNGHR